MNIITLKNVLTNGTNYELECAIDDYIEFNKESKFKNKNQLLLFKKLEADFDSVSFDTKNYLIKYIQDMEYNDYKFI